MTASSLRADLQSVTPLGADMLDVRLRLESAPAGVLAGHYVLLHHPDGARIPFSLASAPRDLPTLHLHYQPTPGDDARRVDELLAAGGELELTLPCGRCGITGPIERPLLLVAGGTGISQVRAVLHELLETSAAPVRLYWGVAREDDLYLAAELDALAQRHACFEWLAAVEASAPTAHAGGRGRVGDLLAEHVAAGRLRLEDWDLLLAGGPPMVWGTVERLRGVGLTEAQTRSDVFEYAPRDDLWR